MSVDSKLTPSTGVITINLNTHIGGQWNVGVATNVGEVGCCMTMNAEGDVG